MCFDKRAKFRCQAVIGAGAFARVVPRFRIYVRAARGGCAFLYGYRRASAELSDRMRCNENETPLPEF
jgi:hypothetical protein